MNTDHETTREIVTRFHSAFENHRPEDLDDLIGEGCVLENTAPAPDGARYEGRQACLDFWKGIASSANLVFEAEEIWAGEDRGIIVQPVAPMRICQRIRRRRCRRFAAGFPKAWLPW